MSDKVLTDGEIVAAIDRPTSGSQYGGSHWIPSWAEANSIIKGERLRQSRAVEQAVLAKCVKFTDGSYAIFRDGCEAKVTEREARRRERAAFDAGVKWYKSTNTLFYNGGISAPGMDALYPLPTVKRPRTVTLSCGDIVRLNDLGHWTLQAPGASGSISQAGAPYNFATTPEDAERLADLVRHPFEEVPDDA